MKEHIGIWIRENPGFTFLIVVFAIFGLGDCGVEFAKALHR